MYTVDINRTLAAARMCIGALRHYAPDDTMLTINEILYTIGQAQFSNGGHITNEGRGRTDTSAREDLQKALALAYTALNVETTNEAPF
jgi:hypothetical protein